jgi:zinc transport system substrate-binding protein
MKKLFFGSVAIMLLLSGCAFSTGNSQEKQSAGSPLKIVASFYPLYFLTSELTGSLASVSNLTPAGAEPHDYEPTAKDMAAMASADLLILNGSILETWGDSVRASLAGKVDILTVGDGLFDRKVVKEEKEIDDPHLWLSPKKASLMSEKIAAELIKIDPKNASRYEVNANILKSRLDELDERYRQGLKNCAKKSFITSHAAFGYLAKEYGLKQLSIAGLSPEIEPTAGELAAIADMAKKEGIKYIFFESLASPKLAETLAKEIGAEVSVLNPIEGLTPAEEAGGKTYFSEMEGNLNSLRIALECQ